jgi:hypothetical protein
MPERISKKYQGETQMKRKMQIFTLSLSRVVAQAKAGSISAAVIAAAVAGLSFFAVGAAAQETPPIAPEQLDRLSDAQIASMVPSHWAVLRAATWNIELRPWFSNQAQVIKEIGRGDWDVIALQGVWSEAARNAILADKQVKAKYKASYWVAPMQQFAFCSLDLPRSELEDLLSCVTISGVDPRTMVQPAVAYDPFCNLLQAGIASRGQQLCLQCIQSSLQSYPDGKSSFDAIDQCYFTGGDKYSSKGLPGLLLLSKTPIEEVKVVPYDTYLQARAVVYATVKGVRLAVSHFPNNFFDDVITGSNLTPGALQPQLVQDIVDAAPRLVLGSFNSGPDYQSEAANLFTASGYKPVTKKSTFCPTAAQTSFPPCLAEMSPTVAPNGQRSIDNIYKSPTGVFCIEYDKLGDIPVSDHIGVGAICLIKK